MCAFIFVFGLLGNGLTLWILVQSKKWKKNTTNMFIVSLTTVQDFDSTFKNYFGEYFSAILTSKLYEIVSLEVDKKIPRLGFAAISSRTTISLEIDSLSIIT